LKASTPALIGGEPAAGSAYEWSVLLGVFLIDKVSWFSGKWNFSAEMPFQDPQSPLFEVFLLGKSNSCPGPTRNTKSRSKNINTDCDN
jgi:hypothetical protein